MSRNEECASTHFIIYFLCGVRMFESKIKERAYKQKTKEKKNLSKIRLTILYLVLNREGDC